MPATGDKPPTTNISELPSLSEKDKENGRYNLNASADTGELEAGAGDDISEDQKPLPPLPATPTSNQAGWLTKARDRWQRTPKRIRYVCLATPLLLTLILALSIGLSHHKKKPKHNYESATHSGDLTYYDTGLGACGITSTSRDYIVAVSFHIFDAYSISSNPNTNPLCGRKIWFGRTSPPGAVGKGQGGKYESAEIKGEKVEVTVVDRCAGCMQEGDLDVSETAFGRVAGVEEGRVGIVWGWVN